MSNTTSLSNPHHVAHTPGALRSLARCAAPALLALLAGCSGSDVSLGSGLDDQESALMANPSSSTTTPGGMQVDCATNPLGAGCPLAEEEPCGRAVSDCYAAVLTSNEDASRCNMLSASCLTASSSEPVDCALQFNDCLVETMAAGDSPARCEMQLEGCRTSAASESASRM